jgi:phosphoribosylformimino-5-aminoimidazole carboxamide ribotide isomerase
MKALPAIDLREGACVQLVGGAYDAEKVRVPDAVGQARAFRAAGFDALHVVDLDAATGRGQNDALVERLVAEGGEVQVGGGVRTVERAVALIQAGAARVIAGTRAVADRGFRAEVADALGGKLVIALDVRGRDVLVKGWAEGTGTDVAQVIDELADLPLAGVLVTAVHREGRMEGADVALLGELARRTPHRLLASGGVGGIDDLRAIAAAGAAAAVIGMALYAGALDASAVAREFSSW